MALLFLALLSALFLASMMALAWAVALRSGKSGWIDAIWSLSVGLTGAVAALAPFPNEGTEPRRFIVAGLAAFWSLRLGLHIISRTRKGGDDPRYAQLRAEWGATYRGKLFQFLQIQAAAGVPLVLSIAVAAHKPASSLGLGDWLGIFVLCIAILGESIGDRQLARFRSDPAHKDQVCDAGLWAFTRHPNFFFEWLCWVAYPLMAITLDGSYWQGWIALSGPILMYWLLVHVSGIPPLEAHMLRSRGAAFEAYQGRVNAFWPGPSKAGRG